MKNVLFENFESEYNSEMYDWTHKSDLLFKHAAIYFSIWYPDYRNNMGKDSLERSNNCYLVNKYCLNQYIEWVKTQPIDNRLFLLQEINSKELSVNELMDKMRKEMQSSYVIPKDLLGF